MPNKPSLSDAEVKAIREVVSRDGWTKAEIADYYKVSVSVVYKIVNRITYKHI